MLQQNEVASVGAVDGPAADVNAGGVIKFDDQVGRFDREAPPTTSLAVHRDRLLQAQSH
jgi:hypothetical protein